MSAGDKLLWAVKNGDMAAVKEIVDKVCLFVDIKKLYINKASF